MTEREKQILEFINSFIKENGYAPTQREISNAMYYSGINTVQYYLRRLSTKGYIKCSPRVARSIVIIKGK